MLRIGGQPFFPSQKLCDEASTGAKFFMKLGKTLFGAFRTVHDFTVWFETHRNDCDKHNSSIQFYEVIRDKLASAFYADIEAYSDRILTPEEVASIQGTIIDSVEKHMKIRNPRITNRGAWTADHRRDTTKDGYRFKVSLHVVFNDLLFDATQRNGPMHVLAFEIDKLVTNDLRENGGPLVNSLYVPKNNVLDMAVYKANGCMRGVFGSKTDNPNEFFRPIGELTNLKDYLITKDLSIEDIPQEKLVKIELGATNAGFRRSVPLIARARSINTEEQTETERVITEHLKTWGDTTSTVKASDPDHNECPRFYVRGPERVCPPCKGRVHDGNGASVSYHGSGNFSYRCLYPIDPKRATIKFYIPGDNHKKARPNPKRYLATLVGITARGVVVKAPMGSGKTFRTREFIRSLGEDVSVALITPRKAMARKLKGDYPDFALYTENMNYRLQIVEYESLHKVNRAYDVIVLDEIRSLTKSFVSTKTNGDHLEENMRLLLSLCRLSRHTLMLDADVHIDGAVKTFTDHVFGAEPVHEVVHDEGSMGLDIVHVSSGGEIITRMMNDLTEGKRIMLCCGSSTKLKAIAHEAAEVVGASRVGAYYADSKTQPEIMDVNLHWEKYLFIGFTSTITCSISYEGEVHRVYVIPDHRTASPREMAQMLARARKILTGQVVVESDTDDLYPLAPDLDALYEEQLAELIRKRQRHIKCRDHAEAMYVSTIEPTLTRSGVVFSPSLLTKLGGWNMVEEYLKEHFWHKEFIRIITGKKFTWRMDEYNRTDEDDPNEEKNAENKAAVEKTKAILQSLDVIKLDLADACHLPAELVSDIIRKKTRNVASEAELILSRKYLVQRYFRDPLSGDQVVEFERNERAIINLILTTKLDPLFRRKLYLNEAEMGSMPEFGKEDVHVLSLLEKALMWCGVGSFKDTTTALGFEENSDMLRKVLSKIDQVSTARSQGKGLSKRLLRYLEYYVGMTFESKRVWKSELKRRVTEYTLKILYPEWLERETSLGTDEWVRQQCHGYDRFKKIPLGFEYKFIKAMRTIVDFCSKYQRGFCVSSLAGVVVVVTI